jgi:hypothetical protein
MQPSHLARTGLYINWRGNWKPNNHRQGLMVGWSATRNSPDNPGLITTERTLGSLPWRAIQSDLGGCLQCYTGDSQFHLRADSDTRAKTICEARSTPVKFVALLWRNTSRTDTGIPCAILAYCRRERNARTSGWATNRKLASLGDFRAMHYRARLWLEVRFRRARLTCYISPPWRRVDGGAGSRPGHREGPVTGVTSRSR